MVPIPAPWSAATCAGSSRRASRPAWIFGCSVLTRPSSISGKPVYDETSVAAIPSLRRSFAVPPVDTSSTASAASACASSTMPDLSETLRRALRTFDTTL